jgi:hypothetical protein
MKAVTQTGPFVVRNMSKLELVSKLIALLLTMAAIGLAAPRAHAAEINGSVQVANKPVAGATVTLYAASAGAPVKVAEAKSDGEGAFTVDAGEPSNDKVLYLVAHGGTPTAEANPTPSPVLGLLAVLGPTPPKTVTINEFTTVASVWTSAQFLSGDVLGGPALGLRIAAGNVPNFVDLQTGGYGVAIQDSLNGGQTPTMANFATLANLLAGALTQITPDAPGRFLVACASRDGLIPTDTLTALEKVACESGFQPQGRWRRQHDRPGDGRQRSRGECPAEGHLTSDSGYRQLSRRIHVPGPGTYSRRLSWRFRDGHLSGQRSAGFVADEILGAIISSGL